VIRRAVAGHKGDLAGVAAVFVAARAQAARDGWIPPMLGTLQDVHGFLGRALASDEVWVDEVDGQIVAMMVLTPGWVNHLYVHPERSRRGIGTALLQRAVQGAESRGAPLQLWTFQANRPARDFYARHGFTEVEFTDGATNMERAPDVRLVWSAESG
jgi:GNAT superfamily N-acetyltransferase